MSDVQDVMNFELLPNEMLIVCFEYLNAFEIFYSFDRLNYRFFKLIRKIRLQLNFENVHKTIFEQFCQTIKSNSEIKNQISRGEGELVMYCFLLLYKIRCNYNSRRGKEKGKT